MRTVTKKAADKKLLLRCTEVYLQTSLTILIVMRKLLRMLKDGWQLLNENIDREKNKDPFQRIMNKEALGRWPSKRVQTPWQKRLFWRSNNFISGIGFKAKHIGYTDDKVLGCLHAFISISCIQILTRKQQISQKKKATEFSLTKIGLNDT